MAATIGNLALKISAQTADLKDKLAQSNRDIKRFADRANADLHQVGHKAGSSMGEKFGKLHEMFHGGGMGMKGGAVGAGIGLVVEAFKNMDEVAGKMVALRHEAKMLGATMEEVSTIKFAAGENFDLAAHAITKFQEKLGEARAGGEEARRTFEQLGMNWKELGSSNLSEQMDAVIKKFNQTPNQADRMYMMLKLFGKQGAELVPIFEKMHHGMELTRKEAERLGRVFTDAEGAAGQWEKKFIRDNFKFPLDEARDRAGLWMLKKIGGNSLHRQIVAEREAREKRLADSKLANEQMGFMDIEKKREALIRGNTSANEELKNSLADLNTLFEAGKLKTAGYVTALQNWREEVAKTLGALNDKSPIETFLDNLGKIQNAENQLRAGKANEAEVAMQTARAAGNLIKGVMPEEEGPFRRYFDGLVMLKEAMRQFQGNGLAQAQVSDAIARNFERLKKDLGGMPDPFIEWLETWKKINAAASNLTGEQKKALEPGMLNKLNEIIGIKDNPAARFQKDAARAKQLAAAGRGDEARMLLGMAQRDLLNAQQIRKAPPPPRGLTLGTVEEFSYRNEYQRTRFDRHGTKEQDTAKALELARKDVEQIKLNGKALLDAIARGDLKIVKLGGGQ